MVATRSRTPVAITSQAGNQFMKAYRITTLFSGRGGEEEEEKGKGVLLYSGKARHTITRRLKRTVGVRIYPLTLAMVLA